MRRVLVRIFLLAAVVHVVPFAATAVEDAGTTTPTFKEGDVITVGDVDKLRPFLPPQFWDNRDFFFYEGMQLEIGPMNYDYSPSKEFVEMTEAHRGKSRIGPDNSLEGWVNGRPFPLDEIDCTGDPQAGTKIMWDQARCLHRWIA